MLAVEVIEDPAAAAVALEPVRSRLLSELAKPASAATLAARLGIARQKVNYHLRALEAHGLVEVAEKRQWGGLTERLLVATAASYVVSPGAMGAGGRRPGARRGPPVGRLPDRPGCPYRPRGRALCAACPGKSASGCRRCRSTPRSASGRRPSAPRSAANSTQAVRQLVARYHDAIGAGGRAHRLVIVAHPLPHEPVRRNRHEREEGTLRPPLGAGRGRSARARRRRSGRRSRRGPACPPGSCRPRSARTARWCPSLAPAWTPSPPGPPGIRPTASPPRADLDPSAAKLATEWIVEARSGGTCIVRVVHSLFASSDDWDDQLESFESGWPWFFRVLRLYLTHFRAQPCSAFRVMGFGTTPAPQAWEALTASLGFTAPSSESGAGRPRGASAGRAGRADRHGRAPTRTHAAARRTDVGHRVAFRARHGRAGSAGDRFLLVRREGSGSGRPRHVGVAGVDGPAFRTLPGAGAVD